MIHILALDTTSKFASISILKDEEIILEYNFATKDELSATLIPSLDFLLHSAGLKLQDIDAFGISTGPGLFTGLRVGLSTLKGLLMGTGKPVAPVIALEALAYKAPAIERVPVVPLIDARRKEVYTAVYSYYNGQMNPILPPKLLPIAKLKEFLTGPGIPGKPDKFSFTGSGANVHKEFLKENFKGCKLSSRSFFLASEVGKIASRRFREKDYISDLQQLNPLYLRKPDAEANFGR